MSVVDTLRRFADIVIIGVIPVKIVKDLSDNFGSTAVGHAVGSNVRLVQNLVSPIPETVQINCTFLGRSKFVLKLALETLFRLSLPFPLISSLTAIPLVTIKQLSFRMSAERKDVKTTGPAIDFTITLEEFNVNKYVTIATKLAWLIDLLILASSNFNSASARVIVILSNSSPFINFKF